MKKKQHYVLVKVSARPDITASEVRREVRTLINEQCNYRSDIDEGDIRAAKVSPLPTEARLHMLFGKRYEP